jgi:cysteinyl-tRNA synthetase
MALQIYNTLTHRKEVFVPRDEGKVSIYACGLTPQGPAHLGHMRGALAFDAIRRWLAYRAYDVTMVQNFTDVDDKIIRKAAEEGIPASELAARYARSYERDWDRLGIAPLEFVKVTENIDAIIALIERLIERGHAYAAPNGDVYFSVATFPGYGKLSRRNTDEMEAGARIEVDPLKRDPMDFALWKAERPGEPSWPSPWGPGRPGWHIECSALSLKYLGNSFDIHAGGIDLLFPHHENEIAQSEAATGIEPFARIWAHWGAVNTGGVKMSKSLGNFFTIDEILSEYPPQVLRLYLLTTHYRSPIEYQPERLAETARSYERLQTALTVANQIAPGVEGVIAPKSLDQFGAAMDDDFNTAQAGQIGCRRRGRDGSRPAFDLGSGSRGSRRRLRRRLDGAAHRAGDHLAQAGSGREAIRVGRSDSHGLEIAWRRVGRSSSRDDLAARITFRRPVRTSGGQSLPAMEESRHHARRHTYPNVSWSFLRGILAADGQRLFRAT